MSCKFTSFLGFVALLLFAAVSIQARRPIVVFDDGVNHFNVKWPDTTNCLPQSLVDAPSGSFVLNISTSANGTSEIPWGGCGSFAGTQTDLTKYSELRFWMRHNRANHVPLKIEMEDADGNKGEVYTQAMNVWQEYRYPVTQFDSIDLSRVVSPFLVTVFILFGNQAVYIDNIRLIHRPRNGFYLYAEDTNFGSDRLMLITWGLEAGATSGFCAEVEGPGAAEGTHYLQAGSSVWGCGLGTWSYNSIDVSAFRYLGFFLRSTQAVKIELDSNPTRGGSKGAVEVPSTHGRWRWVQIEMSRFSEQGVLLEDPPFPFMLTKLEAREEPVDVDVISFYH